MNDPLYDDALAELIERAMAARDAGEAPDYAALCDGHEHLVDAVRQACDYADALHDAHRRPDADDAGPERIVAGRYRLQERLGSGAMGIVYRAIDVQLGRPVAIKLMRAFVIARKEAEARFAREAQALAALQHPAVVTVHDRGVTEDGEPFLVMELLEGISVGDLLAMAERRGERVHDADTSWIAAATGAAELPEGNLLRASVDWVARVAEGLQAAHAAGLVHRDVKPSNLFLTRDARVVLLDFGIASRADLDTITRDGGPLGTPAYMAPESLDADRAVAPGVDVYGLTATLYHLLTLRAPFRGTPSQVLSALARRDPTPADRLRRGLPRDLLAILDKGMAKDPGGRYPTANALADDLRRFLEHRPVSARPVGTVRRLWRRARRSRPLLAVAATAGVTAASWFVWHHVERDAELRRERSVEVASHLTPQVTLATLANRRSVLPQERAANLRLLDELVELGTMAPWARVVRGMYRFDHGEHAACSRDLDAAAAAFGTPFATAVAEHHRARPGADSDPHAPPVLDALPAPDTADDHLLAAYLALRAAAFDVAADHLADPGLLHNDGAELLRLFVHTHTIEQIDAAPERVEPAIELVDRLSRLESRIGRSLACTRHLASFGLAVQSRYGLAGIAAAEALDRAPFAYGSAINAGFCFRRAGRYDDALHVLERAARIRPDYFKPTWDIALTRIDAGDLDGAERTVLQGPLGDGADADWRRDSLRGAILAERAMHADDEQASRSLAAHAVAAFERAGRVRAVRDPTRYALALAVRDGDARGAFVHLLRLEGRRPAEAARLHRIRQWMPPDLSAEQTAALATYFAQQADRLDPAQPRADER